MQWGAPRGSSDSCGVAGISFLRPGGRRVRSWSMGLVVCSLGVVRFVRDRLVQWGAPWRLSGSVGVTGFSGVRRGGRRVRPGSLGSVQFALAIVRSFRSR